MVVLSDILLGASDFGREVMLFKSPLVTASLTIAFSIVGLIGCGGSSNRQVTETDEYSFEEISELAQQDLEQSESFEEDQ